MKNILEKILNDKKQSLKLIKKDKSLDTIKKVLKIKIFIILKK